MALVVKARFDGDSGDGVFAFKQQRFGPVEASVDEVGSQTQAEALFESSVEDVWMIAETSGELLKTLRVIQVLVQISCDRF